MTPLERMGGSTRAAWLSPVQIAAFRSLATSRGLEFADVVRAAEDGRLRDVVEMRDIGKQRRVQEQALARIRILNRKRELGILLEGNYI
jgi:hypothetical protein